MLVQRRTLCIVVASTVALTAACSADGEGRAQTSGSGTISVRSAITPSASLTGPFLYGIDKGYYKDAGLKVSVSDGKGSLSVAKDVAQGNVDIGQVGSPTVAQAVNQEMPLISVAQQYGRGSYGVIVDQDSKIKDFSDFEDRTVIVSAGSPETVLLPAALDKAGVDQSSVRMLNVDPTVKGTTYSGGQADALGTTVPFFMPVVSSQRESRAMTFDDFGVTMPDYSLVVRPDFLEGNADEIRRFLTATFKASRAAANDPDGVVKALQNHRPAMSNAKAQTQQWIEYQDFVCSSDQDGHPVGWHSPKAWESGLDLLSQYQGIQGEPKKLDAYYTNQFFEGETSAAAQSCTEGKAHDDH